MALITSTSADPGCDLGRLDEPEDVARAAGLRYVNDDMPGISRRRQGTGFSYWRADGSRIADGAERERIEALAIPPAWTDVWIAPWPDAHLLATGRDDADRKQYRYHDRWREVRDAAKYLHLAEFAEALPDLRRAVAADLRRRTLTRERVLAGVVRLLDTTLIRIGNDTYAADNETFGATTLRPEHVHLRPTVAWFRFDGKGGDEQEVAVRDHSLLRLIEDCLEAGGQDLFVWKGGDGLVDVTSDDVNEYLRARVGDRFTAKTFRTWGGTTVAGEELALCQPAEDAGAIDSQVLAALDQAAARLGNTRAVCRACYVAPQVPEAHREGVLVQWWDVARRTKLMSRAERTVARVLEEADAVPLLAPTAA